MTSTRQVKILFGCPTPFDFKLVEKYQAGLEYDIIKPKYYKEIEAYRIIRDFFLIHKEYTHLAIACSDIVVFDSALKQLEKDVEQFDPPVISGMMNLALEFMGVYNITKNVVNPEMPAYDWFIEGERSRAIEHVYFSGFPLMVIRRDIVERIPFERTSDLLGVENEINCLDISFCWRCAEKEIPIFADTRVKLLHLKELNDQSQPVQVGIKQPYTEFLNCSLSLFSKNILNVCEEQQIRIC